MFLWLRSVCIYEEEGLNHRVIQKSGSLVDSWEMVSLTIPHSEGRSQQRDLEELDLASTPQPQTGLARGQALQGVGARSNNGGCEMCGSVTSR